MNGVLRYTPDKALALIREMLEAAGLEVHKKYHDDKLAELEITNPAALERGDMSITADGFVTWDCETTISDDKGIREIVDVITVLLAATAPSGTGNPEDRPLPDPAEGMLS